MSTFYLSQTATITTLILTTAIFATIGFFFSKGKISISSYLAADRSIGRKSLTASLTASCFGVWILIGPSEAATWGGLGAVIGYALGQALPFLAFITIGKRMRKVMPDGNSLTQFVLIRFGEAMFKLVFALSIFYMFVYLCAEVTAIAKITNLISGFPLWQTSLLIIITTLSYTLYGGLRASIFTDNIQMIVIVALLLISVFYLTSFTGDQFSFSFIKEKSPHLLSASYIPNYTAGLTFFIAVAATNLFHQGNWQRVYAAKNNDVLKKSLIFAFIIIIPIVLFMGFSGLVAISVNSKVIPDLGFFSLLLRDQTEFLSMIIVILGLSLTISTVDTLVNAISSLIVVDGKATFNLNKKTNYLTLSKYFIVVLSIVAFAISSKGFSVLYLFLLADLFCCAFVLTVFYSFYNKQLNEKTAYISIILGLIGGFLLFPAPDFSKSLLVGIILPTDIFPAFVSQSLLFLSFIIATFLPVIFWKIKGSNK